MQSVAEEVKVKLSLSRLDKVPIGRFHYKLILVSGIGWMFDALDVGLISYVVATLAREWKLSPPEVAWLISISLLGMLVGAGTAGSMADRWGRKTMFQATLLIFSFATGLCAIAWSYAALICFRFLVGFGLGGELPIASTLVTEFSPAKSRGKVIVILESFWSYGWVLAALLAFLVIPKFGWRIAFILGALPAFYTFVLRRSIPESPRFLLSKGRTKEAMEIVRMLEKAAGLNPADEAAPETQVGSAGQPAEVAGGGFRELWHRPHLRRTIMLWIMWFTILFGFYGIFTWLPTLLTASGRGLTKSFEYVLIMTVGQIPGYFSAAYLVDRLGRKWTVAIYLFLAAVGAFFFRNSATPGDILFWGFFLSFFFGGGVGVVYVYTPELYPTRIRATGAGWAAACGRAAGVIAPLVPGWLLGKWGAGYESVFIMFAGVLLAGAINVLLLGEETKGRTLEQIAGQ